MTFSPEVRRSARRLLRRGATLVVVAALAAAGAVAATPAPASAANPAGTTVAKVTDSFASSTFSQNHAWSTQRAVDGNTATQWSSVAGPAGGVATEFFAVRLAGIQPVSHVRLTPSTLGGFPVDFSIQVSTDGASWIDVPGQSYTGYHDPGTTPQLLQFATPVQTKWIRVLISKLGPAAQNTYFAQFAEVEALTTSPYLGPAPSPRIVTTTYATDDIVVSDYDVTDATYGADPTGVADSTDAIQRAIDDAYTQGGGTVWLPSGTYKVTRTIYVDPFVSVRGDRRDPDQGSGGYGTVIAATPATGASGTVLFEMHGSSGLQGLTVFYPSQTATSPTQYDYTVRVKAGEFAADWVGYTFKDLTFLNSYKAIGISPAEYETYAHASVTVTNVKGTALNIGIEANNAQNVDLMRNIEFAPRFWADAGSAYNAPSLSAVRAQTYANAIAYKLSGLEWDMFAYLFATGYKTGIQLDPASRYPLSGVFANIGITDSQTALLVNQIDSRTGVGFARSILEGTQFSVKNASPGGYVKTTDSILTGPVQGTVTQATPQTSPTQHVSHASPVVTRSVLYDATASYSAPFVIPESGMPTQDATSAIQAALDAAGAAGGGVVYLRAGWYRLDGHLTVPANVELRGAGNAPRDNLASSRGTVLLAYEGRNTTSADTATAAVTLGGNKAGLRSIRFFYPEGNPADTDGVNAYPFSVRLTATDNYVADVGFSNSYNGIDAASSPTPGHYINNVHATFLHRGIVVNAGANGTGWVETVSVDHAMIFENSLAAASGWTQDFGTIAVAAQGAAWSNVAIVEVNAPASSMEHMLNVFSYATRYGLHVVSGRVIATNLSTDGMAAGGYTVLADTGSVVGVKNSMRSGGSATAAGAGTVVVFNEMVVQPGGLSALIPALGWLGLG